MQHIVKPNNQGKMKAAHVKNVILATLAAVAMVGFTQCKKDEKKSSDNKEPEAKASSVVGRWQRLADKDRYEGVTQKQWMDGGLLPILSQQVEVVLRPSIEIGKGGKGNTYPEADFKGAPTPFEWEEVTDVDSISLKGKFLAMSGTYDGELKRYPHQYLVSGDTLFVSAIYKDVMIKGLEYKIKALEGLLAKTNDPKQKRAIEERLQLYRMPMILLQGLPNFTVWRAYKR